MKNISITVRFESRQEALISLEVIDFAVARQNKPDSWSWPEYAVTKAHAHILQKSLRAQLERPVACRSGAACRPSAEDHDCTVEASLFDWSLLTGELLRAHLTPVSATDKQDGFQSGCLDLYKLITSAMMRNKQARRLLAVQDEVERARSRVREARERLQDEELELLEAEVSLHRIILGHEEDECRQ